LCLTCTAAETSKLEYGDRKARREELHVHTRAVLVIRSVSCGHSGLRKFCGVMDLPPPLSNYEKSAKAIHNAVKQEAEESMNLYMSTMYTGTRKRN
jgi:hypothetical protein